jgi:transcriptional regulator with GAF, ATPase, and Fis domain
MDSEKLAGVLSEVAETASETIELQQVFDRVAGSVREIIPLDHLKVVRMIEGERAVVHATTIRDHACAGACSQPYPVACWSPRLRPGPGPMRRIDDVERELDPSFPADADILAGGTRSALWAPFYTAQEFRGGVWLSSHQKHAFTDEHLAALRPIAALLGSAVEHWRIWDAERRRRERLDKLEGLAAVLMESLDVCEVFDRISEAVQPALPHALLVLSEHDERARTFQVIAHAGEADGPAPTEPVELSEREAERRHLDHEIIADMQAELAADSERNRVLRATGMRSWLRVPVRRWGEIRGALGFMHREPGHYTAGDVEVAQRIAERIALAICHHQLAKEAQAAAEASERAARLEATVETLSRELQSRERNRIVGDSSSWRQVLKQVGQVAPSDTTVLITGESGTGKEVVAHLVHQGSPRAERPFVAVNCAALPDELLESELFGHEKGAFTGAVATKIGRFEQADGGTLFLDEIGEMSPLVQAKVLRALEQLQFQRLGGTRTLDADVRVIAATNRNLQEAMAQGRFREDLFYRLAVFEIHVPALRERGEDILPLAELFRAELEPSAPRPAAGISRDARDWLLAYPWPGNVRELRNAMERAVLLCDGGLITREHLPAIVGRPEQARRRSSNGALDLAAPLPAGGVDLAELERCFVEKALEQTRGNKAKASRLLGLTRAQLYSRLDKYGLR